MMEDAPMPDCDGAIIDRFYGALGSGDLDAALACLTSHAQVWHSFDGHVSDRQQSLEGWRALLAGFPERAFVDVRRHAISSGFVQQHMMTARTLDGALVGWPICVFVEVTDGLISRIDEYIDRAGRLKVADLHEAKTPGLGEGASSAL